MCSLEKHIIMCRNVRLPGMKWRDKGLQDDNLDDDGTDFH